MVRREIAESCRETGDRARWPKACRSIGSAIAAEAFMNNAA